PRSKLTPPIHRRPPDRAAGKAARPTPPIAGCRIPANLMLSLPGFPWRRKSASIPPADGKTAALGRKVDGRLAWPQRGARRAVCRFRGSGERAGAEAWRRAAGLSPRQPGRPADPRGGDELDRDPDD